MVAGNFNKSDIMSDDDKIKVASHVMFTTFNYMTTLNHLILMQPFMFKFKILTTICVWLSINIGLYYRLFVF